MRRRKPDDFDLKLEGLLLAIGVHGPGAVFDHLADYKWLRENYRYGFHQVKCKLRETGMEQHEVEDILLDKHVDDCACWRCVMRLHVSIVRRMALMRVDESDAKLIEQIGQEAFDAIPDAPRRQDFWQGVRIPT